MGANSYIQKILQRERILQPAKVKSLYMKNVWAEKWHPQSYFLTSFTYNNSLEVKNVGIHAHTLVKLSYLTFLPNWRDYNTYSRKSEE